MKYVTTYMSVHEQRTLCYSENIQENKEAAEQHATENPRAKGKYLIAETIQFNNGSYAQTLNPNAISGEKHGKTIAWRR